jgi:hypothetical protein
MVFLDYFLASAPKYLLFLLNSRKNLLDFYHCVEKKPWLLLTVQKFADDDERQLKSHNLMMFFLKNTSFSLPNNQCFRVLEMVGLPDSKNII